MGIERVDYYSDEEYEAALAQQAEYEEEEYKEYMTKLDYSVQEAVEIINSYAREQKEYLFSLYCMKCYELKNECTCKGRGDK